MITLRVFYRMVRFQFWLWRYKLNMMLYRQALDLAHLYGQRAKECSEHAHSLVRRPGE